MEFSVFLTILIRRKYVFLAFFILILAVPLFLSVWKEPIYRESSVIQFKKVDPQTGFLEFIPRTLGEISYFDVNDTQNNLMTLLEDETIVLKTIEKLGYDTSTDRFTTSLPFFKFLLSSSQQALKIEEKSGNELFEIHGYAPSPEEAAAISEACVQAIADSLTQLKLNTCARIKSIILEYSSEIQAKLDAAQEKKHRFFQEYNFVDVDKQLNNLYEEILENRKLEQDKTRFLNRVQEQQAAIQNQLATIPEFHNVQQEIVKNPVLSKAEDRLTDLLWEMAGKKVVLTDQHGEIIISNAIIEEIRQSLDTATSKILSKETWERNAYNTKLVNDYRQNQLAVIATRADLNNIRRLIEDGEKETVRLAVLSTEHQGIADDVLMYKNIIKQNQGVLNSISVVEKMQLPNFEVIHSAGSILDDSTAYFPDFKRILAFSLFLSFWTAFVAALAVDYMDPSAKSTARVEALFGIPIATRIPYRKRSTALLARGLPAAFRPGDETALRFLVSWLKNKDHESACPAIGVTSATTGEGVTSLALRLAGKLADLGETVLLLEANAVNPCLKKRLKVSADRPVTDAPPARQSLVQTAREVRPGLYVHTIQENERTRFFMTKQFIDDLKTSVGESRSFQWTIIDLPAVLEDAATAETVNRCDAAVFLIAPMKVKPAELAKALNQVWNDNITLRDRILFAANEFRPFRSGILRSLIH